MKKHRTGERGVPGVLAPWLTGLILFSLLAGGATAYLARPRQLSPVPQSVLDSRRESTTASAQAITRSLDGGLTSLAEIATVVDESIKQRDQALLAPFRARKWKSLYVLDRTSRTVVAQVGEPAQPAALGEPLPEDAGMIGTASQVVQHTPVGRPAEAKYVLVGHLDVSRLRDLLTPAAAEGAWLVDRSGAVIEGVGTGRRPQAFVPPAADPGKSAAGSQAQRLGTQLDVFAWASLTGRGPATALGWTVVSVKPVTGGAMAADDSRRRAVTAGGTLAVVTAVVFGALFLVVLCPIRRLGQAIDETRPPARRSQRRRRRQFSPVAVVWAVGATALLGLGAGIATTPSSWLVEDIPQSVVTEQRTRTALAARQLQRSLNSGVADLKAVAAGIRELDDNETAGRLLTQLLATRDRYRGATYLSSDGAVLARAGDDIDVAADAVSDEPALTAAPSQDMSPRVHVSVPVTGDRAGRIVAEFTPQALIQPLALAGPGNTRLLSFDRLVIGATSGSTAFAPLIRPDLDQAARSTRATGTGAAVHAVDGRRNVVSWAPVTSPEAARQLGLSVVTDRPEISLALPHSAERSELALLGVLIATFTVVIFGWLYVVVIGPLHAPARDAARIADGSPPCIYPHIATHPSAH